MNIGFVGLGKLGLPCALAMEHYGGHRVCGYDLNPAVAGYVRRRRIPYQEFGGPGLLETTALEVLGSVAEVVARSEIVFLAVQTPHAPEFEGVTPYCGQAQDFDYRFLVEAVVAVDQAAREQGRDIILAVISTVLPGTIEREVVPVLSSACRLVYNPFFIAMGTTVPDLIAPEFVLLGGEDAEAMDRVAKFYGTIHDRPVFRCSIRTAEATKVLYNTFIGCKIIFGNAIMELAEKTGADADGIYDALALATDRIISPRYMRGGMGDGGGCHPRDQYALAWLAEKHNLSHNIFRDLMLTRDHQTSWLAGIIQEAARRTGLPVVLLGRAYKPETNLTVGSPAVLLSAFLSEARVEHFHVDPHVDGLEPYEETLRRPAVYCIATRHRLFGLADWPAGSEIIDPWGIIPDHPAATVRRLGRPRPLPPPAPGGLVLPRRSAASSEVSSL